MSSPVLLAQVGSLDDVVTKLVNYGVLGIFCVLLIGALVWTVKSWKGAMEGRMQDALDYSNALKALNDALHTHSVETVKAIQTSNAELKALNDKHSELKKVVEDHDKSAVKRADDHQGDVKKQHEGIEKTTKDGQDAIRRDIDEVLRRVK